MLVCFHDPCNSLSLHGATSTLCIIIVVTLSAFRANMSVIDLVIMAVFGLLGVFMKIYGWPRPPVIIAIE